MQLGAYDYLTKPFDLEEVKLFAERAISNYEAGRKIRLSQDSEENISFEEIVGSSPDMLNVYKLIGRTASKNIIVLIAGESGTGKELIARAIHYNSPRRKKRLVSVNISAIPKGTYRKRTVRIRKGSVHGCHSPEERKIRGSRWRNPSHR